MKIYYRYNGFIRSSELNLIESTEEEFRETFVLLGEFGEEIYDLFGVVLVEKSWNSSNMSYNISGFNKTGNGNLGYYEGETLQVLYNIFKESWDYIRTEEEALEQLDITVERLEIEIVPNPDKLNDKDDLYNYLEPNQRIIKSCSRVKVKVPQEPKDLGQYEAFYLFNEEEIPLWNLTSIIEKLKQSHLNSEYGDIPPPRSWVSGDSYYGINVSIFEKDKAFTGVPSIYDGFENGYPKDSEVAEAEYLIKIENLMSSKFNKLNGNIYVPKTLLPVEQIGEELIAFPMEGIAEHILYNTPNEEYIGNSQSYTYFDIYVRKIL